VSDQLVEPDDPPTPEYRAIATRWEHGYEIQVVGAGITQTHEEQPQTVEETARNYVSLMLNVPDDSFRLTVDYQDR